jgi:hypothetical protein
MLRHGVGDPTRATPAAQAALRAGVPERQALYAHRASPTVVPSLRRRVSPALERSRSCRNTTCRSLRTPGGSRGHQPRWLLYAWFHPEIVPGLRGFRCHERPGIARFDDSYPRASRQELLSVPLEQAAERLFAALIARAGHPGPARASKPSRIALPARGNTSTRSLAGRECSPDSAPSWPRSGALAIPGWRCVPIPRV